MGGGLSKLNEVVGLPVRTVGLKTNQIRPSPTEFGLLQSGSSLTLHHRVDEAATRHRVDEVVLRRLMKTSHWLTASSAGPAPSRNRRRP
jgi:hypothetical protein